MKKFFLFAAVALFAAAACDNTTSEQKRSAFDDAMDKIVTTYQEEASRIDANTEMFIAGTQEEAYEKAYKKATGDLLSLVNKTVRKNPKDTVALYAIQSSVNLLMDDLTVLGPAVNAISGPLAEDEFILQIKEVIAKLQETSAGKMFKDFTVESFTGDDAEGNPVFAKVNLSDFVGKGKYILLDFWSPWCVPCKKAIPSLKEAYDKYHSDKFDIVSVAVWEESRGMDYRNTVDTAAVYGMNWNLVNNGHLEPADIYGVEYIPYLFLFGPDGKIVERNLSEADLDKVLAKALGR